MRSAIEGAAALAVLASLLCPRTPCAADAFARPGASKAPPGRGRRRRSVFGTSEASSPSSRAAAVESIAAVATTTTSEPPSWEDLSDSLAAKEESIEPPPEPRVTLYRDTNGWCPFCERVWVLLRAKGIPYAEQLINLQNKPEWYKALVPTTLVPAVLFHGDEEGEGTNERRIVWESADIARALDKAFPDTPKMILDSPEYDEATAMNDDLISAGFGFVYARRNDTLPEEEKAARRAKFAAELDRLDAALEEQQRRTTGGEWGRRCFRLGEDFTAVDAIMVPTLERWRHQLPLTTDLDVLEGRPALARWFDAMDAYEPYAGRVRGDAYSWTATNSQFLRYFGGGEDEPEVAAAIARSDGAAERLAMSFAEGAPAEGEGKEYSKEAAAKLVANHEAVVRDCTRDDPRSQQHVGRVSNPDAADAVLRHVAGLLLADDDTVMGAREAPLPGTMDEEGSSARDAAAAARVVASRLCVPRDMSAPAAAIFRAALAIVADRLEE